LKIIFKNIIINELYYLVIFFPLWWFLGVEQFFWFVSVGLVFIQFLIYSKFEFRANMTSILLLFFLVIYGISFFSIQEKMRYITYFRNLSTYLTAFMLLIISWNIIDKWSQIEKLLKAIVFVMFIASIVGILAFSFEIFRVQFKSLTGYLLPAFITKTGYGSVIAVRNVGFYNWFLGMDTYFRPSSFFLYSTMFSSTLAIVLPIAMFLRQINKGIKRKYYSIVVLIMILALLATTGRVAILSFFLAFVIFQYMKIKDISIRFLFVSLIVFLSAVFLFWLANTGVLYQIIDVVLYSRGEGSANTRMKIYTQTLKGFLQRPFFGWGTERDVNGLDYPLGSHSYYLGTLYKQGLVGLFLFISIIIEIWKKLRVNYKTDNKIVKFLKYGQLLLLVYVFNSFTDVLDLDATTMMFLWLILSLLIVSKRVLNREMIKKENA
tara:strand:+ start:74752 stop:76056 length:1305 start_codon:yes stop_codon:yes gene_type:complete